MKIFRVIFSLLLFLSLGPASGWGDTKEEATFTSVKGRVKVLNPGGQSRRVKDGQLAYPGETIQVGTKSTAHVNLPDGSSLNLSPDTHLTISSMKQPTSGYKIFLFRLGIGKVFAQVRKLMSAKSSFEIEAGGVVCGVRGTEFTVGFDPETKKMDLEVYNGAVAALGSGVSQVFTSGQKGNFQGGHWDGKVGNAGSAPKDVGGKDTGKGGVSASVVNNSTGNSGSNGGSTSGTNNTTSGTNGNGPSSSGTDNTTSVSGGNSPSSGGNDNTTTTNLPVAVPISGNTQNTSNGDLNNLALNDLNNQQENGILVNGENNLNKAQQTINIHLVVP